MKKRLTKDKIMGASTYILVTAAFLILQLLMSQGKLSSTIRDFWCLPAPILCWQFP